MKDRITKMKMLIPDSQDFSSQYELDKANQLTQNLISLD